MIVLGDINNMGYEERLSCCRQLAGVLDVGDVEEKKEVSQAFPDSLFLSDEDLQNLVSRCNDTTALQALYHENRHRVAQKPVLQQLFAGRRQQLETMNSCIDY